MGKSTGPKKRGRLLGNVEIAQENNRKMLFSGLSEREIATRNPSIHLVNDFDTFVLAAS